MKDINRAKGRKDPDGKWRRGFVMPEGEVKDEIIEKRYGRTLCDRKFVADVIKQYDATLGAPYRAKVDYLMAPPWKKLWWRLGPVRDWVGVKWSELQRWNYARKWQRMERAASERASKEEGT